MNKKNDKIKNQCPFCDERVDSSQCVFKNEKIKIICPRRPITNKHLMIMPISHVADIRDLKEADFISLFSVIKKIESVFKKRYRMSGYNLFVNNGESAGQHVPHVHFHFFPRFNDEKNNPLKVLNNIKEYNIKKLTSDELKDEVELIRRDLEGSLCVK